MKAAFAMKFLGSLHGSDVVTKSTSIVATLQTLARHRKALPSGFGIKLDEDFLSRSPLPRLAATIYFTNNFGANHRTKVRGFTKKLFARRGHRHRRDKSEPTAKAKSKPKPKRRKKRRLAVEPPKRNIDGDYITWWEYDERLSYSEAEVFCKENKYPAGPQEGAEGAHVLNLETERFVVISRGGGNEKSAFDRFGRHGMGMGPVTTTTQGRFWVASDAVQSPASRKSLASIDHNGKITVEEIDTEAGRPVFAGVICVKKDAAVAAALEAKRKASNVGYFYWRKSSCVARNWRVMRCPRKPMWDSKTLTTMDERT